MQVKRKSAQVLNFFGPCDFGISAYAFGVVGQNLIAIETELKSVGFSVSELCRRAKIAQSTWVRWKRGDYDPQVRTARRVQDALKEIRREAAEKQAAA